MYRNLNKYLLLVGFLFYESLESLLRFFLKQGCKQHRFILPHNPEFQSLTRQKKNMKASKASNTATNLYPNPYHPNPKPELIQ